MSGSKGKHGKRRFGTRGRGRQGVAGLRVVAIFEAAKGLVVVLAGAGCLAMIHRNAQAVAEEVVRHLHFNPAKHVPRIFLEAAAAMTDARLWVLALTALLYALVRFAEGYGLWRQRAWAEWFGILSGSIYLPVEIYELAASPSKIKGGILLVNLLVVGWLCRVRWQTKDVT
jgi:uncharacterized membrane protein (DUF2068 family)